jgi:hypothetical protein
VEIVATVSSEFISPSLPFPLLLFLPHTITIQHKQYQYSINTPTNDDRNPLLSTGKEVTYVHFVCALFSFSIVCTTRRPKREKIEGRKMKRS